MKIILAIDDSIGSRRAVKEVTARDWPKGSTLLVLNAYDSQLRPMARSWLATHDEEGLLKARREVSEKLVSSAVAKLRAAKPSGIKITSRAAEGSAERVIIEEAERFGADLIVLGSHGHSAWDRLILGSTAHTVALHAPCSVHIVRGKKKRSL